MKSPQKDYSKDKANFSLISGLYHQIKQTFYITLFVTPVFWIYSKSLAAKFGFEGEYWDTVFFLLVTSTFELIIGKTPKSIKGYKHHFFITIFEFLHFLKFSRIVSISF